MSLDTVNADGIEQGLARWAANPGPEPEAGFSVTSFLGSGVKGLPSATLEVGGSVSDVLSAFGTAAATAPVSAGGMFALPTQEEQKQQEAARQRMLKGDAFDVSAGNVLRSKAQEFAPDPATSHKADQVMHGLVRFGSKAVAAVGTMGPAGALVLGTEEGNTVTQDLRARGVDTETAAKVGAVQGVLSAAGAVVPIAGRTIPQTLGLIGVGGPGSYMAQEALSREILQAAGYQNEASLHNPFDPLGLTLSTVIPGGFGALHMRGTFRRAEAVKSGVLPLEQMKPEELRALKYNDPRLDAYASATAERYGVPPAILLAIKNAGEKSDPTAVSPKGAKGVMQFMPGTAKEMGLADATDPVASIDAGARYLKKLHDAYGSWDAAVAHYNGGGAQAAIVRGGGRPTYNETAGYLDRVQKYVAERTAQEAAKSPEAVDAARVAVLNDTVARSLPDTPDAMAQVQRAADIVAESGGRQVVDVPPLIPQADSLTRAERQIEQRLARKLENDLDAAIAEYAQRPDSMGGKVLNTDIARELSPDYLANRTLSAAVHEPSSWFIKQLYDRMLGDIKPGDSVVFTSGGTGAGKTTAIENVAAARHLQENAAIVYDTNMNTLASAVTKIEKALKAGADVEIVHVQRDPVDALLKGALPRAMRQEREFGTGRTVPISEHAKTHAGAARVIQQLAEKYAGDPRVAVRVIDNTRGKNGAVASDLGFVRSFDYNDVEGKLNAALEQEFQAGRISEAVYRATANRAAEGGQASGGDGARPERSDRGQAAGSPDFGEVSPKPAYTSPAGEKATAPLDTQIATRLAQEQPDLLVRLPGSDENITVATALKRIADDQKQDAQWADLVKVAAECALGA